MKIIPKYSVSTYNPNSVVENERTDFTRRIPSLPKKQLERDSKIVRQIMIAADVGTECGGEQRVLDLFFRKAHLLSNPRYWEVMRTVWIVAGSTETAPMFRRLMKSARPCRSWFMTPEDAADLDVMEFPLTVWRAYDSEPDPGISWTIDREWCEDYARSRGRKVKTRQVVRDDIFAYISRRGESEIIILD